MDAPDLVPVSPERDLRAARRFRADFSYGPQPRGWWTTVHDGPPPGDFPTPDAARSYALMLLARTPRLVARVVMVETRELVVLESPPLPPQAPPPAGR